MSRAFRKLSVGSVRSDRSVRSFLVVLSLLFCCITSLATDAATRDLERVRIGYSVDGLILFPLIVAKENRFFEQAGEESLRLSNTKQTVPISRVADFTMAREVYRELKAR